MACHRHVVGWVNERHVGVLPAQHVRIALGVSGVTAVNLVVTKLPKVTQAGDGLGVAFGVR